MELKFGDRVRCRHNEPINGTYTPKMLRPGEEYLVHHTDHDFIYLQNTGTLGHTMGYFKKRFEVVSPADAQELDRFFDRLDASVAPSRQPQPAPALAPYVAPAWATVRFPTHPSDILKLLSDI